MTTASPTVTTETQKLPSNKAVRDILAYYVALCHEKGLDPHTGEPLKDKKVSARKAPVKRVGLHTDSIQES